MIEVIAISFWMYLLFGITALPWGLVADRLRGTWLMLLFFLGAGVSGLAAALCMDSPGGLTLALAGIGLFSGIYHPTGLGMISKGVKRLGMAMGYNGVFGNLGMALAPFLTGIANWLWGPRSAYLMLGGLNLLGVGLMICLPVAGDDGERDETHGGPNGLLIGFLILLIAMMLGGMVYRGATVILPAYFELKSVGILRVISGVRDGVLPWNLLATSVTSLVFLVGIFGQYVGGRVADRFEPRLSYLGFHAVTVPVALLMATTADASLITLALIYFFFLLGMQPIENTLVARLTPRRFHHSAYGIKFVLAFGMGALAVKMVEWIQGAWGIEAIFSALGMISLALVITVIVLIRQTNAVWQCVST
jgi:MFS family permease